MSARRSTTTLVASIALLTAGAVATFAMGLYPVAVILILLATGVAVAERSQLARSLRPASADERHRLWTRSALWGALAVVSLVVGMIDLGNEETWPAGRVIAYNAVFLASIVAALAYLIVSFRRPRPIS